MQKGGFDAENWNCKPSEPTKQGASCAAALAARVSVPPGEKREVVFSLAWDSPEIKFLKGKSYHRYEFCPTFTLYSIVTAYQLLLYAAEIGVYFLNSYNFTYIRVILLTHWNFSSGVGPL